MRFDSPAYEPPVRAVDTGHEFNPETETHHFGLLVKFVDPGCTLELQIEECTGRVTRLTTTDNSEADLRAFKAAVDAAVERVFAVYGV